MNNAKFEVELPALKKFVDSLNTFSDVTPPKNFCAIKIFLQRTDTISLRDELKKFHEVTAI